MIIEKNEINTKIVQHFLELITFLCLQILWFRNPTGITVTVDYSFKFGLRAFAQRQWMKLALFLQNTLWFWLTGFNTDFSDLLHLFIFNGYFVLVMPCECLETRWNRLFFKVFLCIFWIFFEYMFKCIQVFLILLIFIKAICICLIQQFSLIVFLQNWKFSPKKNNNFH